MLFRSNIDCGIYTINTSGGTIRRLCSTGATAQSGTSSIQVANVTTVTRLEAGTYYMAICNSSTGTLFGRVNPTAVTSQAPFGFGWASAAAAGTLSATLTAVTYSATRYPWFGFSRYVNGQY